MKNSSSAGNWPNIKGMLLLSFAFFITLFAFFSSANIYSKILKDRGYGSLGFIGLAVLYISMSTTSFFAPSIAGLMSDQRALQIGALSFTLYVLTGLVACSDGVSESLITITVLFGCCQNGVLGAILWVAQGKYLGNCVKICPEKAGSYASMFWTIALGSQIFAYMFNSIILGHFSAFTLFSLSSTISIFGIIMFGLLPKPVMPEGYVATQENPKENLNILLSLIKSKQVLTIYGLFFNSAVAAATAQGLLIPFFCLILRNQPLQEQLRLSSLIMVVYGFGAMLGGQILGIVNDKFGGSKAVSKANVALHIIIYGSLFLCNEIHQFNFLCFFAGFWIGAADSSMMTQIQVLASNYFKYPGQVMAILNIIKTFSMSIIMFLASFIATKEAFRWYFLIQIVINVASQLYVLFNFNFEDSLKAKDEKKSPLTEGGPPGEHELQKL